MWIIRRNYRRSKRYFRISRKRFICLHRRQSSDQHQYQCIERSLQCSKGHDQVNIILGKQTRIPYHWSWWIKTGSSWMLSRCPQPNCFGKSYSLTIRLKKVAKAVPSQSCLCNDDPQSVRSNTGQSHCRLWQQETKIWNSNSGMFKSQKAAGYGPPQCEYSWPIQSHLGSNRNQKQADAGPQFYWSKYCNKERA